jgi:hypothetical protein
VIATQVVTESVGAAGETLLWTQLVFRILFSGAMGEILGMMGFMQLIVYYPLIHVKFPPTALILFN